MDRRACDCRSFNGDPGITISARAAWHRGRAAGLRRDASTLRSVSANDDEGADPPPAVAEALAGQLDAAAAFHEGQAAKLGAMSAGSWRRWP
jgi:hypothetical protein